MKFSAVKAKLPSVSNVLLAVFSAILLVLAFPDFEFWFLAYVALVPLLLAVERQKESVSKSFLTGWIFGTVFIFGSCWWLTYSLIRYGGIPTPVAYFLLLGAAVMIGTFFAVFAGALSKLLNRFGLWAIFSAPFLWMALEFARYYLTANNWNMIAYSQAFLPEWFRMTLPEDVFLASIGGIYLVGLVILAVNAILAFLLIRKNLKGLIALCLSILSVWGLSAGYNLLNVRNKFIKPLPVAADVVAIQPNVPMSGLKAEKWLQLRDVHVQLAEKGLSDLETQDPRPKTENRKTVVIFPESPMNFAYTEDREFQQFLRAFAQRNNVSVLFNAAEPAENGGYYNAAVMVDEAGAKIVEYDKIHLVPFGEYVPLPKFIASAIPTMAGNFEFGKNYNLMPFGDAKAGMMICFESHFPTLSRRLVGDGADVLVEMTNDGYLGPTPVLRQHLASTVFRAIETDRPVLRTTNVGITAYVTAKGIIIDPSKSYTEETRLWTVSKSDGSRTFYVRYGDWAAWLSVIVSIGLLILSFRRKKISLENSL